MSANTSALLGAVRIFCKVDQKMETRDGYSRKRRTKMATRSVLKIELVPGDFLKYREFDPRININRLATVTLYAKIFQHKYQKYAVRLFMLYDFC